MVKRPTETASVVGGATFAVATDCPEAAVASVVLGLLPTIVTALTDWLRRH